MGFPGHPMRNTILTYFARGNALTDTDKLLLRTVYGNQLPSGSSPFAVLALLAKQLGSENETARREADVFLRKTIKEMEDFADGKGEAPTIILRPGKATQQGLARGQTEIQYFLGLAYLRGYIVSAEKDKAQVWLSKAAASSHVAASTLLQSMAEPSAP